MNNRPAAPLREAYKGYPNIIALLEYMEFEKVEKQFAQPNLDAESRALTAELISRFEEIRKILSDIATGLNEASPAIKMLGPSVLQVLDSQSKLMLHMFRSAETPLSKQ